MKILIELPSWLGDAVMATPSIENIVNFDDEIEITLIGSIISIDALKNHPKVVKTIVLEKKYSSLVKLSREIGRFDLFFSYRNTLRSKIFKFFISASKKYQFKSSKFPNKHQVEKYNEFINLSLNRLFSAGKLVLYNNIKLKKKQSRLTLGLNPGASYGSSKRWYPEEFAKVAEEFSSKYDIIIFGSKNEVDIANAIEEILIRRNITNYQNLAGKTSISQLINSISSLDLFITGDTGPMHIAAAFQVPSVTIFGPTRDDETSQWMNESIVVKTKLNCQPCMQRTCPLQHNNCMKFIGAGEVIEAANKIS